MLVLALCLAAISIRLSLACVINKAIICVLAALKTHVVLLSAVLPIFTYISIRLQHARQRTAPRCLASRCVSVRTRLSFTFRKKFSDFYPRMGIANAGISCRRVSVCLSVCLCVRLSVTSRCSTETAKCRTTKTTPYDSPGILFF